MRFYTGVKDIIDPAMFKKRATRAAQAVARAAAKDINGFVPSASGRLRASMEVDGRKVHWKSAYAGILLYGQLMIDPGWQSVDKNKGIVGRFGGFPMPNYGPNVFFSRPGVKKINSHRYLHYKTGMRNWIREAQSAYGDRWLRMAQKELMKRYGT